MAKNSREFSPAERVLIKWKEESEAQGVLPDFDPAFAAKYPNLWVFLTWREVQDASKDPGSFSCRIDGTGFKITYSDPTAKRSLTVVATTYEEAMKNLDLAIVADNQPWVIRGQRNRTWRKKKK